MRCMLLPLLQGEKPRARTLEMQNLVHAQPIMTVTYISRPYILLLETLVFLKVNGESWLISQSS